MLNITNIIINGAKSINKFSYILAIIICSFAIISCSSPFEKEVIKNYKSQNSSSRINNSEDNSVRNFKYLDKNLKNSMKNQDQYDDSDLEDSSGF
jgi:hypothetical protein